MATDRTEPDDATREEEERDAAMAHDADRPPTPDEAAAADEAGPIDDKTRRAYQEATETGADVKGEGAI